MNIHIVAGGKLDISLEKFKMNDAIWVGVDRGTLALLDANINPKAAFGDFDSVSEEERSRIKENIEVVKIFSPQKDETDTELALKWALEQRPERIRIFGGTGGRQDHFLANIQLLIQVTKQGYGCEVEIIDRQNVITVKGAGTYTINFDPLMKYISFFPVTEEVKELCLQGFKYPLERKNLTLGTTLCISNELIDDIGTYSFTHGILMVIRSRD